MANSVIRSKVVAPGIGGLQLRVIVDTPASPIFIKVPANGKGVQNIISIQIQRPGAETLSVNSSLADLDNLAADGVTDFDANVRWSVEAAATANRITIQGPVRALRIVASAVCVIEILST